MISLSINNLQYKTEEIVLREIIDKIIIKTKINPYKYKKQKIKLSLSHQHFNQNCCLEAMYQSLLNLKYYNINVLTFL